MQRALGYSELGRARDEGFRAYAHAPSVGDTCCGRPASRARLLILDARAARDRGKETHSLTVTHVTHTVRESPVSRQSQDLEARALEIVSCPRDGRRRNTYEICDDSLRGRLMYTAAFVARKRGSECEPIGRETTCRGSPLRGSASPLTTASGKHQSGRSVGAACRAIGRAIQ